jgi:hypothetical protein
LRRKERGNVKLFLSKKAAIIEMLETPSRLHHQLIKFASQYSQWADVRHLGVMCWMIVGLIGEGSVNLTKWIDHIQTKAQIAQSTLAIDGYKAANADLKAVQLRSCLADKI